MMSSSTDWCLPKSTSCDYHSTDDRDLCHKILEKNFNKVTANLHFYDCRALGVGRFSNQPRDLSLSLTSPVRLRQSSRFYLDISITYKISAILMARTKTTLVSLFPRFEIAYEVFHSNIQPILMQTPWSSLWVHFGSCNWGISVIERLRVNYYNLIIWCHSIRLDYFEHYRANKWADLILPGKQSPQQAFHSLGLPIVRFNWISQLSRALHLAGRIVITRQRSSSSIEQNHIIISIIIIIIIIVFFFFIRTNFSICRSYKYSRGNQASATSVT